MSRAAGMRTSRPIIIDPEFQALVPRMSAESLAQLEANIREEGLLQKISVIDGPDGFVIVDGHHRYEIMRKLGEDPDSKYFISHFRETATGERVSTDPDRWQVWGHNDYFEMSPLSWSSDREAVKLWILEHQVGRRNLTDDQRAMIWNEIREHRSARVRAEQLTAARDSKAGVPTVEDETTPTGPKQRTRAAVAKESGLPERKLRTAQAVSADPELSEKVRAGEITLKQAKQRLIKSTAAPRRAPKRRHASDPGPITAAFSIFFQFLSYENAVVAYEASRFGAVNGIENLDAAWKQIESEYYEKAEIADWEKATSGPLCAAINKSGKPCKGSPYINGYCGRHRPAIPSQASLVSEVK